MGVSQPNLIEGDRLFACKSIGLVDTISYIDVGIAPFGMIPAGHRHFMAGPRATDAYEPRQIRKEAAISKAGCVAGFPAIPVLGLTFEPSADPVQGIILITHPYHAAKPPLITGLSS
jgi:hypothetical protein